MKQQKEHKKGKKKKIVIKDKKKFFRAIRKIGIGCLLLSVLWLIFGSHNITIHDNTNVTTLNAKKYAKAIKAYYETPGMQEKFLEEYQTLQRELWSYAYQELADGKAVEEIESKINQILLTDDWSDLGIKKNTRWKGSWNLSIYDNYFTFQFERKEIEPSWSSQDVVKNCIKRKEGNI